MDTWDSDLTGLMVQRQVMYRFLARAYRHEVDQDFLYEISQINFPTNTNVPEIDAGFQMLEQYLRTAGETTLTDLAADYAHIFLGAGPTEAGCAFPYESVYTSARGLLMQEARDQILELYHQEGIQRSADFHDPEDHVALELEFAAHLCDKTIQALNKPNADTAAHYLHRQSVFLEQHLLAWIPRLCADVERIAATDFYKALGLITTGYLAIDRDLMGDLEATSQPQPVFG